MAAKATAVQAGWRTWSISNSRRPLPGGPPKKPWTRGTWARCGRFMPTGTSRPTPCSTVCTRGKPTPREAAPCFPSPSHSFHYLEWLAGPIRRLRAWLHRQPEEPGNADSMVQVQFELARRRRRLPDRQQQFALRQRTPLGNLWRRRRRFTWSIRTRDYLDGFSRAMRQSPRRSSAALGRSCGIARACRGERRPRPRGRGLLRRFGRRDRKRRSRLARFS